MNVISSYFLALVVPALGPYTITKTPTAVRLTCETPAARGVRYQLSRGKYLDMRLGFVEAEELHDVLWDQMRMTGIAV